MIGRVILLGIVWLQSCAAVDHQTNIAGPKPVIAALVNTIQEYMQAQHNMSISSVGQASEEGKLSHLNLGFHGVYSIDEDQARWLIVDAVEHILDLVNDNDELRSIVSNYPFGPEDLTVPLLLYGEDGSIAKEPYVAIVSASCGSVEYLYKNPVDAFGYSRVDEEPFQKAVARVHKGA